MIERKKATKIGLFFIGLTFFIAGLTVAPFLKDLILQQFYKEIALEPGTLAFKRWTGANNPIKTSFYFWNWTNPEQITEKNVKPHFVEMGPYVFWQYRQKVNVIYNSENGTVTYQNKVTFYFDPTLSNGSASDQVTSINTVTAAAAYISRTWVRGALYPVSIFLRTNKQNVWWTKNVIELVFTGFENTVQKIGSFATDIDVPEKFAYFYGLNDTVQSDVMNVDAGKNDVNKIGQVYFVNYKNETDAYPGCKEIKGTNADFFAPFVTPDRKLEMYFPEICMTVNHFYIGESAYEGLKTYVFATTKKTFDNRVEAPETKCIFEVEDAPLPGIFDMGKCRKDASVIGISLPHFLHADPYHLRWIEGMNPDKSKHRHYENLEPTTGIQVNTTVRIQLSVRLTRNPGLSLYRDVPDMYVPVFWQQTEILLEDEYISAIKTLIFYLQYGPFICYGLSGAGFATVIFVAIYHFSNRNSPRTVKRNLTKKIENLKEEEQEQLKIKDENEKETVKYVKSNYKDWI